ncbi:DUF1772 domain-containing protein [Acuticoccus sp. MNP-M23]|uniref:anthrone oxygenase family protein n=1 Tax=Acuticoccus sp. MNP-M23 TaxID=3072793 RepID=UPI002814E0E3|nr:anthrone oxygenase family protein [Acuticoccus sp. MNP-M23]WMS41879.1 DUF1772 domain-containing protein [Acuticoccus sp. MNP-M23]
MSPFLFVLTQFAILSYALLGGVFLAFSDFIMRSLSLTRGAGGVEAMQIINREVFRWMFMTLFLGTALVSLLIAGFSTTGLEGQARLLISSAALVYLAGCFGVTVLFNVPMNEALGRMQPESASAHAYWTEIYIPRWTFWNSVRTVACIFSATLALFGLLSVA